MENIHLVKSSDPLANQIKKTNIQEIKEVEKRLISILNDNSGVSEKLVSIEKLLLYGQNSTQELLKFGFTGLAKQNMELIESNQKLSDQLANLQNQFEVVVVELTLIKKQ